MLSPLRSAFFAVKQPPGTPSHQTLNLPEALRDASPSKAQQPTKRPHLKGITHLTWSGLASQTVAVRAASIHDIAVKDINGKDASLKAYKGKVVLIVNVASQCGLTPQYKGLEAIHEKYKEKGFAVLGFPCNQFGGQEPGTNEEIKQFCSSKYNVTFPLFDKIDVNGPKRHPLYIQRAKTRRFPVTSSGTLASSLSAATAPLSSASSLAPHPTPRKFLSPSKPPSPPTKRFYSRPRPQSPRLPSHRRGCQSAVRPRGESYR